MKVLLIQPPIEDFYNTSIRTYPLSLLYLATKIADICDVSVEDMRSKRQQRLKDHPFPDLDTFYRHDTRTPFNLFSSYSRFGMNRSEIKRVIRSHNPDIVGVSSLFTTYSREAIDVAQIAKEIDSHIITVLGGTHPTLFPERCFESPHVDYVIRGEGETPFFNLVSHISKGNGKDLSKYSGVSYRDFGHAHISDISIEKDIDLTVDRTFVNASDYCIGKHPYTFFLTSRGCPFQCAFCGKPPVPYRKRSLAAVTREIETCIELGIQAIDFEDDMLNLDIPYFKDVLDVCKGKDLTLSAMNGLYAGNINRDLLDEMYDAGFRRLNFSLVDTSKSVHLMQSRSFPEHLADLLTFLESTPFLVEAHFIIGLPGQKPRECIESLIYLMGKRLLPGPSIYYLAPGSALFSTTVEADWMKYIPVMRSSALHSASTLFPRETLYTFMKLTRFINFVKNIIDRNNCIDTLADVPALPQIVSRPHEAYILSQLLNRKHFVWFDESRQDYSEEPQDKDLVSFFFDQIQGKIIRGYKTMNSVTA